jgi:hypothetical protein
VAVLDDGELQEQQRVEPDREVREASARRKLVLA